MSRILNGLEGVVCLIDDTLVFEHTREEHDRRLTAVLTNLETAEVTLYKDKCSFGQESLKFLGHIINKEGIRPDSKLNSYEQRTILNLFVLYQFRKYYNAKRCTCICGKSQSNLKYQKVMLGRSEQTCYDKGGGRTGLLH